MKRDLMSAQYMPNKLTSIQMPHGEKMIEIRIHLWTDQIAETHGETVPKHALDAGIVSLPRNKSHGIPASDSVKFHTLMQLPAAIEKLLVRQGIQLQLRAYMILGSVILARVTT